LLAAALPAFLGNTRMVHDRGQLLQIGRRVKGTIERGTLDLATYGLLQRGHRRHPSTS
jgi:hypothetical protein